MTQGELFPREEEREVHVTRDQLPPGIPCAQAAQTMSQREDQARSLVVEIPPERVPKDVVGRPVPSNGGAKRRLANAARAHNVHGFAALESSQRQCIGSISA